MARWGPSRSSRSVSGCWATWCGGPAPRGPARGGRGGGRPAPAGARARRGAGAALGGPGGRGDERTSLVVRAAQAGRGVAYGVLGVQALRQLGGETGSQDSAARHWTGRLLDMPFGTALVIGAGVGVLGYAAYQLYRAFSD